MKRRVRLDVETELALKCIKKYKSNQNLKLNYKK